MKQPRPTTLVFGIAAALVVAVSVLLTLRRGDAATREPARFSGSRIVQRMPSLLADARLPTPLVVDILRDDAAASFYTAPGALDSIVADWRTTVAVVGATARVVNAPSARDDRSARVLVIPSSPCLTVEAYEAIDAVTARGGGVVITGLTGIHDAGCRPIGYGLIVGITGASRADTLESRPMAYVTLPADNPLTIDIPPGSRIDLNPGRQVALRLPRRDAFYSDYALQPEPAAGAPLLDVAITHDSRGRGRVVYWGFELRDVVRLPWDRALAKLLVRNSLAWAAGLPMAAVEAWPKGRVAAATIAQDVEAGFQNAQFALDSLRAAHIRSTFFLTSNVARRYDGLTRDLPAVVGEIACVSEDAFRARFQGRAILRANPARFARKIARPWKRARNASSESASRPVSSGSAASRLAGANSGSETPAWPRPTGQTSWQRSQPNTQSPMSGRSSRGIQPRFSIV